MLVCARSLAVLVLSLAVAPSLPAQEVRSDTLFTVEKYLDFEQVADPQISPDGSQVIYARRYVDKLADRWESALWIMGADGSRNRFLVRGSSPRWSPDGTRIAYLAEGQPRGAQIHVRWMDAEGATTQVSRLTDPVADIQWSPDGNWIGFSMTVPMTSTWKIDMPSAPTGATWTKAPRHVESLHYRQDRRGFTEPGFTHLFVIPSEGGTPRQVTSGKWSVGARFDLLSQGAGWSWTPDGRTIVFDGMRDSTRADMNYRQSNVYAVDVATGSIRQLTPSRGTWSSPVVSPGGRLVAFSGYADTSRASYHADDVWVMNLDGSGIRNLTPALDSDPSTLRWSRDGSGIYFSVGDRGTANV